MKLRTPWLRTGPLAWFAVSPERCKEPDARAYILVATRRPHRGNLMGVAACFEGLKQPPDAGLRDEAATS